MAIKNKTRYAILGILSIAPGSGYDIKKYCDTIISNFWNENYGHIYPVLNGLLKEGFIEIKKDTLSARKKEYAITRLGQTELLQWLIEPVQYQPVRSEFFLKLVFSSNLSTEHIITMLKEYKNHHDDQLKQLQEKSSYFNRKKLEEGDKETQSVETAIAPERELFLYAPLRYGILSAQAAIAWCDEMLEAFSKLAQKEEK